MANMHIREPAAIISLAGITLSAQAIPPQDAKWWKEAVVYQIYPRSFNDSNGDGIGDLNGITEKLDYLKNLGVDVIWLSPHFDSPNADNGYDIRNYRKVMAEFGTMEDFDRMLSEIKRRNMKLIIDLVVNHTSDEHQWFKESRKSKENPYRDYYIWRDGRNGDAPNNYPSFFGGSAWKKDDATGQYYLHYFAEKQPDLNWENKKVREEVYDIMRFWLDKGVSGFRMDVIPFISKQDGLPDLPPDKLTHSELVFAHGPRIHEYLQEMNREVLSRYDTMTVGEAFGVTFEDTPKFINADRNELNMLFHFDIVRLDRDNWRKTDWTLPQLKAAFEKIDRSGRLGWNTSFLSNHDHPRAVSHFGDDSDRWRVLSAKALATMMLTQRATPFLYQGDELGMTNYPFRTVTDFEDVEVRGLWKVLVESGQVTADEFLQHLSQTSRDNARTPMQWSEEVNSGFSEGTPWLAVNPNYRQINAASQIDQSDSVYNYHRELIALRRQAPALIYGEYRDLDPQHNQLFAYTRTLEDQQYLVAINFSHDNVEWDIPDGKKIVKTLISNRAEPAAASGDSRLTMKPWQAVIFQI
ncbi:MULTISPECIES: alpha-glucosidase [unclassified Brenneria]|uniref:glycoside hydrolase family 13 protein n=1 Tax=unclassified Brenneria TaxID=2634434 RepID=UPI0029C2FF48|nr:MULTISPECIES: alpha-glucosidase [unclassified Brenneria]MDX5630250.1 alpha-glucosidase [Brenneria sp. L3-3Z]MDX5697395.1 alpha-glucosidase [Brenneria sp. L4-2C]